MIQKEMRWLELMSSILANQDGLIKVMQNRVRFSLRWWQVVWLAELFLLIFGIFDRNMDPDFGWHLATGRYILAHGIPPHDLFSYTAPNFSWIDHEWLSDTLTAALWGVGGFGLVAGFFAVLWTAAIAIASRTWQLPIWLLGLAAVTNQITARPTAWTALGLALLMWLVGAKKYWLVVPLFLLWANLHGGFVIGFVVLILAALWDRRWWLILAVSVLATFVNPYGPRLYVEIWRTLSDPLIHSFIKEWGPLQIGITTGAFIFVYLFVIGFRGFRLKQDALAMFLLVSGLLSARQFQLFMLAALAPIAELYRIGMDWLVERWHTRAYLVPVAACVLLVIPIAMEIWNPGGDIPVKELANLKTTPCAGRLFNDYDYGGYIIWLLPGTKVFIDGRMASWKSGNTDYLQLFLNTLQNEKTAERTFKQYDIGCALLQRKHTRLVNQLTHEGWRVTAQGPLAEVLRRP
jgi:hypothetical protein